MDIGGVKFHSFIEMVRGFCPKCGKKLYINEPFMGEPTFFCIECDNAFKMKLVKMKEKDINREVLDDLIKEEKLRLEQKKG
jgi:hypothetical protein